MQARARIYAARVARAHTPDEAPLPEEPVHAGTPKKSESLRSSSSHPFAQHPFFGCGMPGSYIGHAGSTWRRGAGWQEGSLHRSHTFASDQLNAVLLRSGGVTADTSVTATPKEARRRPGNIGAVDTFVTAT